MTKILIDEAVVTQALEVVQCYAEHAQHTIAALRQALADAALDKMAENARELGLSYEQPAPAQEPVAKVCHDLEGHIGWNPDLEQLPDEGTLLYTTPPAPAQPLVGLTDEEIDRVTDAQWAKGANKPIYAAHRAYARAIEAVIRSRGNT